MKRWVGLLLLAGAALAVGADDKKDDGAKEELKKLEGTWLLVSANENGNKVSDDLAKAKLVIKGDRLSVVLGVRVLGETMLTVDPSHMPKTMEMTATTDKDMKTFAIYELSGDTLRICSGLAGQRPSEFTGKSGSNCGLYVYKRDKK